MKIVRRLSRFREDRYDQVKMVAASSRYGILRALILIQIYSTLCEGQWTQPAGPFQNNGPNRFVNQQYRDTAYPVFGGTIQSYPLGIPTVTNNNGDSRQLTSSNRQYRSSSGRYARRSKREAGYYIPRVKDISAKKTNELTLNRTKRQASTSNDQTAQRWDFHPSSFARNMLDTVTNIMSGVTRDQPLPAGVQLSSTENKNASLTQQQRNNVVPNSAAQRRPPTVLKSSQNGRGKLRSKRRLRGQMANQNSSLQRGRLSDRFINVRPFPEQTRGPAVRPVANSAVTQSPRRPIPTAANPLLPTFITSQPFRRRQGQRQPINQRRQSQVHRNHVPANMHQQQLLPIPPPQNKANLPAGLNQQTQLTLPAEKPLPPMPLTQTNPVHNPQQNQDIGVPPLPPMRFTQQPQMKIQSEVVPPLPPMRLTQGPSGAGQPQPQGQSQSNMPQQQPQYQLQASSPQLQPGPNVQQPQYHLQANTLQAQPDPNVQLLNAKDSNNIAGPRNPINQATHINASPQINPQDTQPLPNQQTMSQQNNNQVPQIQPMFNEPVMVQTQPVNQQSNPLIPNLPINPPLKSQQGLNLNPPRSITNARRQPIFPPQKTSNIISNQPVPTQQTQQQQAYMQQSGPQLINNPTFNEFYTPPPTQNGMNLIQAENQMINQPTPPSQFFNQVNNQQQTNLNTISNTKQPFMQISQTLQSANQQASSGSIQSAMQNHQVTDTQQLNNKQNRNNQHSQPVTGNEINSQQNNYMPPQNGNQLNQQHRINNNQQVQQNTNQVMPLNNNQINQQPNANSFMPPSYDNSLIQQQNTNQFMESPNGNLFNQHANANLINHPANSNYMSQNQNINPPMSPQNANTLTQQQTVQNRNQMSPLPNANSQMPPSSGKQSNQRRRRKKKVNRKTKMALPNTPINRALIKPLSSRKLWSPIRNSGNGQPVLTNDTKNSQTKQGVPLKTWFNPAVYDLPVTIPTTPVPSKTPTPLLLNQVRVSGRRQAPPKATPRTPSLNQPTTKRWRQSVMATQKPTTASSAPKLITRRPSRSMIQRTKVVQHPPILERDPWNQPNTFAQAPKLKPRYQPKDQGKTVIPNIFVYEPTTTIGPIPTFIPTQPMTMPPQARTIQQHTSPLQVPSARDPVVQRSNNVQSNYVYTPTTLPPPTFPAVTNLQPTNPPTNIQSVTNPRIVRNQRKRFRSNPPPPKFRTPSNPSPTNPSPTYPPPNKVQIISSQRQLVNPNYQPPINPQIRYQPPTNPPPTNSPPTNPPPYNPLPTNLPIMRPQIMYQPPTNPRPATLSPTNPPIARPPSKNQPPTKPRSTNPPLTNPPSRSQRRLVNPNYQPQTNPQIRYQPPTNPPPTNPPPTNSPPTNPPPNNPLPTNPPIMRPQRRYQPPTNPRPATLPLTNPPMARSQTRYQPPTNPRPATLSLTNHPMARPQTRYQPLTKPRPTNPPPTNPPSRSQRQRVRTNYQPQTFPSPTNPPPTNQPMIRSQRQRIPPQYRPQTIYRPATNLLPTNLPPTNPPPTNPPPTKPPMVRSQRFRLRSPPTYPPLNNLPPSNPPPTKPPVRVQRKRVRPNTRRSFARNSNSRWPLRKRPVQAKLNNPPATTPPTKLNQRSNNAQTMSKNTWGPVTTILPNYTPTTTGMPFKAANPPIRRQQPSKKQSVRTLARQSRRNRLRQHVPTPVRRKRPKTTTTPWTPTTTIGWQAPRRQGSINKQYPVPTTSMYVGQSAQTTHRPNNNTELLNILRRIANSGVLRKNRSTTTPAPMVTTATPAPDVNKTNHGELLSILRKIANSASAKNTSANSIVVPTTNITNVVPPPIPLDPTFMTPLSPAIGQQNMQLLLDALAHNQHKTESLNTVVMNMLQNQNNKQAHGSIFGFDPNVLPIIDLTGGQRLTSNNNAVMSVLMKPQQMPELRSCRCYPKMIGCPVDKKLFHDIVDCNNDSEVTCCDDN